MAKDKLPPPFPLEPPCSLERLFTIKDAANATGLAYWLLLRATKDGSVPTYKIGNRRARVRLSDIEAAITAAKNR